MPRRWPAKAKRAESSVSASAPALNADHSAALDALRILGALGVFFKHASLATGQQLRPHYGWMNHFEIGPPIFFMLSAFLVYRPFARRLLQRDVTDSIAGFAMRRVVRIVPLYWLVLAVLFAFDRRGANGIGINIGGVRGAIELATFTHIYNPAHFFHGIAAAYTLDVEVSFYVFVALWVFTLHRGASRSTRPVRVVGFGIATLFGINLGWRLLVGHTLRPAGAGCGATVTHWTCAAVNWLPGFLDYFAFGMAFALAFASWEQRGVRPAWVDRGTRHPWPWILLAGCAFVLFSLRFGTVGLETLHGLDAELRHELLAIIVVGLMIPAIFCRPGGGWFGRLLSTRAVAVGAQWTYGFYLWHQGWLDAAMRAVGGRQFSANFAVTAPMALVYAVAFAGLSYRLVERPTRSLFVRMAGR